jgi:hypothetical protein
MGFPCWGFRGKKFEKKKKKKKETRMGTYDGSSLHIIEAFPPYEALIKKHLQYIPISTKNPNSYTNSPHLPLIDHKTAS